MLYTVCDRLDRHILNRNRQFGMRLLWPWPVVELINEIMCYARGWNQQMLTCLWPKWLATFFCSSHTCILMRLRSCECIKDISRETQPRPYCFVDFWLKPNLSQPKIRHWICIFDLFYGNGHAIHINIRLPRRKLLLLDISILWLWPFFTTKSIMFCDTIDCLSINR